MFDKNCISFFSMQMIQLFVIKNIFQILNVFELYGKASGAIINVQTSKGMYNNCYQMINNLSILHKTNVMKILFILIKNI